MNVLTPVLLLTLLLPLSLATPVGPAGIVVGNAPTSASGQQLVECHGVGTATQGSCSWTDVPLPYVWNNLHFFTSSCNREIETCSRFTGVIRFTIIGGDGGVDRWDYGFLDGVKASSRLAVGDGTFYGGIARLTIDVAPYTMGAIPRDAALEGNPGGAWHAWLTVTQG